MDNIDPGSTALAALIGGVALWIANRMLGKAAVQEAINRGFETLMKARDQENAELKATNALLRSDMVQRDVVHSRQLASLRGQVLNLTQALQSRDAALRRVGIAIPRAVVITDPVDDIIELPATTVPALNPPADDVCSGD